VAVAAGTRGLSSAIALSRFLSFLSAAKSAVDNLKKSVYPRFSGEICGSRSDRDFDPEGVCRFVSRSQLGHGFGALPAPGGSLLFCFD
jgi:hypothetical protein